MMLRDTDMTEFLPHLLKVGEWIRAPKKALEIVQMVSEEYGGNVAIGNHPEKGWFVSHDQGRGPKMIWREK